MAFYRSVPGQFFKEELEADFGTTDQGRIARRFASVSICLPRYRNSRSLFRRLMSRRNL